jgi:hypothetical protein
MKTRVIVLDERPTAKYRWPGGLQLVSYLDNDIPMHCCLGVVCRQAGASLEDLGTSPLPDGINTTNAAPGLAAFGVLGLEQWHGDASTVNDSLCLDPKTRAEGVAQLRKIFREAGANRGERWIIRWIRDKGVEP